MPPALTFSTTSWRSRWNLQEIIPGKQHQKRPGKYHCRNQDCHVDLPFQTLMETMRFIASMPMSIITKAPATIHWPMGSRNRISM